MRHIDFSHTGILAKSLQHAGYLIPFRLKLTLPGILVFAGHVVVCMISGNHHKRCQNDLFQRQRTKLGRELEERLRDERQQRDRIIPGDFALANMTRTLTSVSAKGAGEQGAAQAGGKRYEDYLDQLAGDEW